MYRRRKPASLFIVMLTMTTFMHPQASHAAEPIVSTGVIDAPVQNVWDAFTTKAGLESWMAAHAEIDLRIGGLMRTCYDPKATIGDDGTIENTILSYQPLQMMSFKVSKPPTKFPFKQAIQSVWTVLFFEPVDASHTRLTITMMGYGDDEESLKMRAFFDRGNQYTLQELQRKFATHSAADENPAGAKTLDMLRSLIGGEWIGEAKRGEESAFRGRIAVESGPDQRSIMFHGWQGDGEEMFPHAIVQVWREPQPPGLQDVRFQMVFESGSIARGTIEPHGERETLWHWAITAPDGQERLLQSIWAFDDADHFRFIVLKPDEHGEFKEVMTVPYQRVRKLPERFANVRAAKPVTTALDHDDAQALSLMRSMIGGDWVFENTRPDKTVFRCRSRIEDGPDGQSMVARGWLGDASGMFPHAAEQMWIEPAVTPGQSASDAANPTKGRIHFQNIDQDGAIARGTIRLQDDHTVSWHWLETVLDGEARSYRVEMSLDGSDHCRFTLFLVPTDGPEKELVNVRYARVAEADARFTTLKKQGIPPGHASEGN